MYERLHRLAGSPRGAARAAPGRLRLGAAAARAGRARRRACSGGSPLERYGTTETGLHVSNPLDGPRAARSACRCPAARRSASRTARRRPATARRRDPASAARTSSPATGDDPRPTAEALHRRRLVPHRRPRRGSTRRRAPGITGRTQGADHLRRPNVYPREVEVALEDHPAVARGRGRGRSRRTLGRAGRPPSSCRATGELDDDALIAHCRERLAAYKCPKRVVALEELPRNPMGKVRRDALAGMAD